MSLKAAYKVFGFVVRFYSGELYLLVFILSIFDCLNLEDSLLFLSSIYSSLILFLVKFLLTCFLA